MGARLDGMGPILTVARFVPVVRSQVLTVEDLQEAGSALSLAGQDLTDATQDALRSSDENTPLSGGALDRLRTIHGSLAEAVTILRRVQADVDRGNGRWLIGPIDDAHDELSQRLRRVVGRAGSAESGMAALVDFIGGNGPRRYLFLSQNPDEIRPTGGFIGMFGVFTANGGELDAGEFRNITEFSSRYPDALIAGSQAGAPFRFSQPPVPQRMGNVNNLPDWPRSAQLAVDLWERAGLEPIDGVASFTPAFLARLLAVLGPVTVPGYDERVTSENVIERFDHYTELEEAGDFTEKKGFVAELGDVVFDRLVKGPSSSWRPLAEVVGEGFAAREAMVWSRHPAVAPTLAERGWDGAFPESRGDFFYNAEFSYAAKNGRGLRRTFDHHVLLREDGSARITTTVRVRNTEEPGRYNVGSLSYVTLYGPEGGAVQADADPPISTEPPLKGHPGAGYFVDASPGGEAVTRVVWDAPGIARRGSDGRWRYSLLWLRVPDHTGDVLNLRVTLPEGWRWKGAGPPSRVELTEDVRGSWEMAKD